MDYTERKILRELNSDIIVFERKNRIPKREIVDITDKICVVRLELSGKNPYIGTICNFYSSKLRYYIPGVVIFDNKSTNLESEVFFPKLTEYNIVSYHTRSDDNVAFITFVKSS